LVKGFCIEYGSHVLISKNRNAIDFEKEALEWTRARKSEKKLLRQKREELLLRMEEEKRIMEEEERRWREAWRAREARWREGREEGERDWRDQEPEGPFLEPPLWRDVQKKVTTLFLSSSLVPHPSFPVSCPSLVRHPLSLPLSLSPSFLLP
jgi:hypothetical protein